MKQPINNKELELEKKLKHLLHTLSMRKKVCKYNKLKYLDRKLKEDSINKVLFLLHETADYTIEELHPLDIWDSEITLNIKQTCYKLLNQIYGFKSNFRL
tara:strand:+ start:164 stop:463 length:300 start_codon:yes stop_codon:yes gene_type:complete